MAVMLPRERWTDQRLDDFEKRVDERFDRVDKRFDRIEADIRELRMIMIGGFVTLIAAMIGLSTF
jgi:tetrahydromethanopterin S-methyltransferase subunit G